MMPPELEALVEREDGGRVCRGRDPRELSREVLAAVHEPGPLLAAIRAKCVDCSGGSVAEVALCSAVRCPLWPYRMNWNPFSGRRGNPEALRHARRAKSLGQQGAEEISGPLLTQT
jgi:hypothetical protein